LSSSLLRPNLWSNNDLLRDTVVTTQRRVKQGRRRLDTCLSHRVQALAFTSRDVGAVAEWCVHAARSCRPILLGVPLLIQQALTVKHTCLNQLGDDLGYSFVRAVIQTRVV
jgi:hypothetical protein